MTGSSPHFSHTLRLRQLRQSGTHPTVPAQGDFMGLELTDPMRFLSEAEKAIQQKNELEKQLSEQQKVLNDSRKLLESRENKWKLQLSSLLSDRVREISKTYDDEIAQVDTKLKKVQSEREKAKAQGIKGRIGVETEELVNESRELQREYSAIMKSDCVPLPARTGLYYSLWHPSSLREFLGFICFFILFFLALPIGLYLFVLPERRTLYLVLIYLAVIIVVGGLYTLIGNLTTGKHREAILQGKELRKKIRKNRSAVRRISREIQSDSDEEGYHLEEYDDEISRTKKEREDLIQKKQAALNSFDTVTKNILTDEHEHAVAKEREELQGRLQKEEQSMTQLEDRRNRLALENAQLYEQFLGKSHMNEGDMAKLGSLLSDGKAQTLMEAIQKLEGADEKETR